MVRELGESEEAVAGKRERLKSLKEAAAEHEFKIEKQIQSKLVGAQGQA